MRVKRADSFPPVENPEGELAVFMAGVYTSNFNLTGPVYNSLTEPEKLKRRSVEFDLESYHYLHKGSALRKLRDDGAKIFLDSGAYSAFTSGAVIDMHAYCDFIQTNMDVVLNFKGANMIAPLDVIGDGEASFLNYVKMEEMGVHTLPCFHKGDRWELLDEYMKYSHYVAIGGLQGSTADLARFFDELFERIAGPDGTPTICTHGFGLNALGLMLDYPWTSVDAATWVLWSANGLMLLPYSGKQVNISAQSSSRKVADQHFDNYDPYTRAVIRNEIEHYETDVERLRTAYQARWAWNIWAFPTYTKYRHKKLRHMREYKQEGLFG